ncbi:TIGR03915 family putative DNA repair protein [Ideonella sp. DXS22W]|uniref:TIGR03915 family putative DNA repair protein n=1 Tax=Pseudaquabacterium inlustre TaxID=2984192 RepID=A0ABU9CH98_9BURK
MSRTVHLAGPDDVAGVLAALAELLVCDVPPEAVRWDDGSPQQTDLFGDLFSDAPVNDAQHERPSHSERGRTQRADLGLPAEAERLLRQALLHAEPLRFAWVHGYARRLHADPRIWLDRLHPDRLRLERMAREVSREIHKMHAFVRFRPVADDESAAAQDGSTAGTPAIRHVAWFEPAHPVLRAAAPFFQRRFAAMRWAILTPWGSVRWDPDPALHAPGSSDEPSTPRPRPRSTLHYGPPARREDAPAADAGEALWLAYYRSTFNPARANPAMMCREMPPRYWPNLPEAALIGPLLRDAAVRTEAMQAHTADTQRRLPAAARRPR